LSFGGQARGNIGWLVQPKLLEPGLRSLSCGGAAFVGKRLAQPKLRRSEGWRPGLDLNQDKERCTALASTLSATGPAGSLPITPR
jgi:hypothetical protein